MIDRHDSKPGRRGPGIALGALLALVLSAAPAAADAPSIDGRPTVNGTPQVGSTLQAVAEYEGRPSWRWYRCNPSNTTSCTPISEATQATYTPVSADVGRRLRVLLTVRFKDESESEFSDATSVVAAAPVATPTPTPSPSPSPDPDPPSDPPVTDPAPSAQPLTAPVPQGAVLPAAAAKPATMMRPAPLVRIGGRLTRSGARITLLTVRAPKGARIAVRCTGRGCPSRRWARTTAVTRIARFQRVLPAGTKLVITVTKPRRIGKHTTIVIRRGKAPTRRDRCLVPGSRKPVACEKVAT